MSQTWQPTFSAPIPLLTRRFVRLSEYALFTSHILLSKKIEKKKELLRH
jgi:hypothetical protein